MKTIFILKKKVYDGKFETTSNEYFETKEKVEKYLEENGYTKSDIFGYQKDYFCTAEIEEVELN